MKKSDYDRFVDILNATSDTVGTKRLSELALGLYWKTLEAREMRDVERGIARHLQDTEIGQFMPKPADIIRQIDGTEEDNALEAWSLVEQGIRGAYSHRAQNVTFSDPVIHMVVHEMGGFTQMGRCKESEMRFVQRDFMQRYAMRSKRPLEDYPKKLPTSDLTNAGLPEAVLIGGTRKALSHDAA